MRQLEGNSGVKHIQCLNPRKGIYAVRWAITPRTPAADDDDEEGDDIVQFMEETFEHKPSLEEIQNLVINWYNTEINERILNGFSYNGDTVWLTSENQFNYKVAYDLAVQTDGSNLPVVFKFGSNEKPVYHQFSTVDELSDFYLKAVAYIQKTYNEGWQLKDKIDWTAYELN